MNTEILQVHPEFPEIDKIAYCARIIRKGGLVVFPTETVYGIAADVSNKKAMERLIKIKNRSDAKPFSILLAHKNLIANYSNQPDSAIYKLIDKYWPGPLTIVVKTRDNLGTVGIRMPDNIVAQKLIDEAQCTIAAPSANLEGNIPPTTVEEALRDLSGLVEVAIDGGKTKIGTGSTVVDLANGDIKVLREGIITKEEIEKVAKKKTILFVCTGNSCRSVMAEYLLKDRLRGHNNVEVLSAGTGVFFHSKASRETLAVLQEEGIDANRHMSQPLSTVLLKKADLIFVMTRMHRAQVLERVPEVEEKLYFLKEFIDDLPLSDTSLDIADPIGGSHITYKECINMIKKAINKIMELV